MSIRDIKAAAAELAAHEAGADSLLCEDCGEHRALAAPHACNTTGEHSLGRYTRAGGAGGVGSGEPTPPTMDLGAINVVGRVLIEQGVDFSEYEGDRTALVPVGRTARAIVQALETWRTKTGVDHV